MTGFYHKENGTGITYVDLYLVMGARTPFEKLHGTLGQISPTDLGIFAAKSAIEKSGKLNTEFLQHVLVADKVKHYYSKAKIYE